MLKEKFEKLSLPELLKMNDGSQVDSKEKWLLRREEIKRILSNEVYGFTHSAPDKVRGELVSENKIAFAGKAIQYEYKVSFDTPSGEFEFPLIVAVPSAVKKAPLILHIAFRNLFPDRYIPVEEIIDRGFGVAMFCYKDITADENDGFSSGLAKMYGERNDSSWGKIGMWAFAASRALDFLLGLNVFDEKNIAVMGHSRLGKTALWAGAQDERFAFVFSNDSGCSGAAVTRDKTGERVKDIYDRFPHWFCRNYSAYSEREHEMPFDQHFLLALTAPRKVYVASAELDSWADPNSEFLSCAAVSEVYELFGLDGLVAEDRLPKTGDFFKDGNAGYHLRTGTHFLSRYDWNRYMDYMTLHKNN